MTIQEFFANWSGHVGGLLGLLGGAFGTWCSIRGTTKGSGTPNFKRRRQRASLANAALFRRRLKFGVPDPDAVHKSTRKNKKPRHNECRVGQARVASAGPPAVYGIGGPALRLSHPTHWQLFGRGPMLRQVLRASVFQHSTRPRSKP
jgi:hypothetical protein